MAVVKPFCSIRPNKDVASKVAALPYDVYNRDEAKEEVKKEPLSFLSIDRAETSFDDTVDMYDDMVYAKAKELLNQFIIDGYLVHDKEECFYLYELIMEGRSQTGLVACASIDDYRNNVIKKHEKTREDKEFDRIKHVDKCNAQTGPIFLAYPSSSTMHDIVTKVKIEDILYSFTAPDGVIHNVWRISNKDIVSNIQSTFAGIESIYIADGHHRAASAVKVGELRREQNPNYSGKEEFNYFLSVFFPSNELKILPYNRVIKDLNGLDVEEFLDKVSEKCSVKKIGEEPFSPTTKGSFGMYLDNNWYQLIMKETYIQDKGAVEMLDVSLLQQHILEPILGIGDPRIDKRIDFIGGIRGLGELEKRVAKDMSVAFSMYPTSIEELFAVSDDNKLMPPKSTWFEPKLRSGLFIHPLD